MQRAFHKRLGYGFLQVVARLVAVVGFRLKCFDRENMPATGGALICANHQSFFDPIIVGLVFDRRLNYFARASLFRYWALRWLIEFLDAIPIERDGMGLAGLKETLKRLKNGELVLIFPEGTRTSHGEIAPLKPGFCAVARRAKVPLVPVGFDGAFQAWPRGAKIFRFSKICVAIGKPISPAEIENMTDEALVAELEARIRECHRIARHARESE